MELLNKIKDKLTTADFDIDNNMKVNDLCKAFRKRFGLTLRVYKGKILADDGRMTIKTLNKRTTTTSINVDASSIKIKATQTIGEVEQLFMSHFGIKVQIADSADKKLLPDEYTLGNARREENK